MSEIVYSVAATFSDSTVVEAWLGWLRGGHIAEVLAGGAIRAEIVALDGPDPVYEIHYRFPSRQAFERYERECAPRLRAEGMSLFPPGMGINYRRSVGVVRDAYPVA
jgi:hypothetical protein